MFHVHSVDFQQRKKLMFLAAFWVYKLKQVDISLLKHIGIGGIGNAKLSSFQMRADFVSIWLMVDYVYGDVAANASEMNVFLNVTVGESRYGVE